MTDRATFHWSLCSALTTQRPIPDRLVGLSRAADSLVSQLMGDGVGDGEARVLVDVAAARRLAHARNLGHTERVACLVAAADVAPAGNGREMADRKGGKLSSTHMGCYIIVGIKLTEAETGIAGYR